MTPMRVENPFLTVRRTILLAAATVTLLAFRVGLAGQTQPALQITSPSDGSVVAPGQTISVSVSSPSNTAFKQVFVIGEQPLPNSSMATSAPASFSILIPQGTEGQPLPLRISGKFADGSVVDVTASSNLAYTSSNASVATVNNNGVVIAITAGSASITATYGQGTQSVHVSVPVTVPPRGTIHLPD